MTLQILDLYIKQYLQIAQVTSHHTYLPICDFDMQTYLNSCSLADICMQRTSMQDLYDGQDQHALQLLPRQVQEIFTLECDKPAACLAGVTPCALNFSAHSLLFD